MIVLYTILIYCKYLVDQTKYCLNQKQQVSFSWSLHPSISCSVSASCLAPHIPRVPEERVNTREKGVNIWEMGVNIRKRSPWHDNTPKSRWSSIAPGGLISLVHAVIVVSMEQYNNGEPAKEKKKICVISWFPLPLFLKYFVLKSNHFQVFRPNDL